MRDFVQGLPQSAKEALLRAGWRPDRRVDVDQWHETLSAEGFVLFDLAADVLATFGGLEVHPAIMHGEFENAPILFEPELAGSGSLDIALELRTMFDQDFYPIAEWITSSCVSLGSAGIVVDYHDVELLSVADSFEEGLRVMLLADRTLPLLRAY
ncbi:MAG TPA: SUKH-3 domain-containing protein [Streptosporangiaceae bacterium]|jgi:hypothetical protein|nr:SUKH-3 domain-containing protein [Streptosporangiaceae bacterium]